MRVYVYPADVAGCGYYRLIWPAEQLRREGHNVKIVMPNERGSYLMGVTNASGELVDVQVPADADVIVLQRISHRNLVDAVRLIRAQGVAVVIDIDDDLAAIHPDNPAFYAFHPTHPPHEHSWRNVVEACRQATRVTVSTNALVRHYAAHGRVTILHNAVPKRYLEEPREDSEIIGWGGSVRSHPNDLQVMGTAITRLTREGQTLRVVGPGEMVRRYLSLDREPESTGTLDIHTGWPRELSRVGVGVAPLADTRFNRGKSWLKMLEMAALGVPCVVSPRVEYRHLHGEGVGVTAESPGEWYRLVGRLCREKSLRDELSERGRDVAGRHTIEKNAWRWAEAWATAAKVERASTPKHTPVTRRRSLVPTEGFALGVKQGRAR